MPKTGNGQGARRRPPRARTPAVACNAAGLPRGRLHRRARAADAGARRNRPGRFAERAPGRGGRGPHRSGPRALGRVSRADGGGAAGLVARGLGAAPPIGSAHPGPSGGRAWRRGLARQRRPHLPRRLLLLASERLRSRGLRAGRPPADPALARRGRPHPMRVPSGREWPGLRDPDPPRGATGAERCLPDRRRRGGALLAQGVGRRAPRAGLRRDPPAGRDRVPRHPVACARAG